MVNILIVNFCTENFMVEWFVVKKKKGTFYITAFSALKELQF